jgi:ATP-dependent Clp protease ATP-binding subunit ClpC
MFEHLSIRAQKALDHAKALAYEFNQDYVGTEHVLLGIMKEGRGMGATVLKDHGITYERLEAAIRKLVQAHMEDTWVFGRLPGTPHLMNVVARAIEEAQALKHNYVGTEHLLLGLMDERGSVACTVLSDMGLRHDTIRERIHQRARERKEQR